MMYLFRWDRFIDNKKKLHTVQISILRRDFRDYFNAYKQGLLRELMTAKDAFETALRADIIRPGLRGFDKPLQTFISNILTNDYIRQLFNISPKPMTYLQPIIDFIRQLKARLRDLDMKKTNINAIRELYEVETFRNRLNEVLERSRGDIPDIYTNIEIGICINNFNSGRDDNHECSLLEYHSITMGANCPYVGFLDRTFSNEQASRFRFGWERSLIMISPNLIDASGDIKIVGDDNYFTYTIPKNRLWEIAKIEVAYQQERLANELGSVNMGEQTDIAEDWKSEARGTAIHKENPVSGEYIVVGNINIPCLVINASIPSGMEFYYDEIGKIQHNKYGTAIESEISNELIDTHRRQAAILSNDLVRFLLDWLSGDASSTSRFIIRPEYMIDNEEKTTGNIVSNIERLMTHIEGGRRRRRRSRRRKQPQPRKY